MRPAGLAGTAVLADGCRNSGTVTADSVTWELVDPVPLDWLARSPMPGDLHITGEFEATFVADDGVELRMSNGATEDECVGWVDDKG